jgi:hypothetical protein
LLTVEPGTSRKQINNGKEIIKKFMTQKPFNVQVQPSEDPFATT